MEADFSDLPELSAHSIPKRSPPPPPSQKSLAIRPPPRPRDSSHLSIESHQSRALPRSINSSRTSLGVYSGRLRYVNIGIDFGTTFSGVSWAVTGSQTIHTVGSWPNGGKHVKVPTVLAYEADGATQWGYSIKSELEQVRWFKLLLAESSLEKSVRESRHLLTTKALLIRLGKTVEDVTADYLRRLWEHALSVIKRDIPGMEGMPFRIVVGMPANWPLNAQERMRSAAAKAGIFGRRLGLETVLEFVAEPEAAAIAAFYEGNIQHNIEIDDTVVICDAGGGTVDIGTYDITRIKPSVTLSESISGNMALCGSIFLDINFIRYIEGLMGKDKFRKISKADDEELMETWEYKIKREYETDREEIPARIPPSVAKVIDRPLKNLFKKTSSRKQVTGNVMRFSSADIQTIFQPVIKDILKLSLEQRNEATKKKGKAPKAILLVGGLGGNKYLYERLQAGFNVGGYGAGDISVLQPSDPNVWASICRGAAIKAMSYDEVNDDLPFPVVTSYISKAHYGMAFKEPYDSSRHTSEDRVEFDEAQQTQLAWDQMSWYVKKGDDVSKGDPVEMTWEFKQPESRTHTDYTVTIFECTTDQAPTRKTNEVRECVAITFTAAGHNMVYQEGNEGQQQFRVVRFDVKMSLCGMGKVDFSLYVNGRIAASRDVRVVDSGGSYRGRS